MTFGLFSSLVAYCLRLFAFMLGASFFAPLCVFGADVQFGVDESEQFGQV